MKQFFQNKANLKYFGGFLIIFGSIFAITTFANPPLFQNADDFLLFTQKELKLDY